MIKTLSPNLVVKVIDACQSGTTYIKESNALDKYFNSTQKEFKSCYFMNSSLNNQSSYQNEEISFFTSSFVKAIKEHKTSQIRYKDIIDVISDEFFENPNQTPFFVVQAEYTEYFCTISDDLKNILNIDENTSGNEDKQVHSPSIFELIKSDAKDYLSETEIIDVIQNLGSSFKKLKADGKYKDFFTYETVLLDNYADVPKKNSIKNWLDERKSEYFTIAIYEDVYNELYGMDSVLIGFDLGIDVPFNVVSIDINSLYPNLSSYHCDIVFMLSKKMISFFHFITDYREKKWDMKQLNKDDLKWYYEEYKISELMNKNKFINSLQRSISNRIEKDIEDKYMKKPDVDEDDLPF